MKKFLEHSGVHSTGSSLQDRKGVRDILCDRHFSFTRLVSQVNQMKIS
jgi:hypothetical protein